MSRVLRRPLVALTVLSVLVLSGCGSDKELNTLDPQGAAARTIDDLVRPVFIVAGIVFLLVEGAVLYLVLRNRVARHDDDEFPGQVHGNTRLEIAWTIVPAVIMTAIAVGTVATLVDLNSTEANAVEVVVDGSTTSWEPKVVVVGQQWWWEYRYYFDRDIQAADLTDAKDLPPADIVTANQMVIPAGEEVELIVTSRDVIHSHWIPKLNGKRDAVPNRFSPWKIEADEPGVYFGQCTEFCGLSHSRMRMQVIAMEPGDFRTWVREATADAAAPSDAAAAWLEARRSGIGDVEAPSETAAERGLDLFTQQCTSCHLIEGVNDDTYTGAATVSTAAPNLTHFASRTTFAGGILPTYTPDGAFNAEAVAAWLRDPAAVKANAAGDGRGMPDLGLSETQIADLVAYLETLGPRPADWILEASQVE